MSETINLDKLLGFSTDEENDKKSKSKFMSDRSKLIKQLSGYEIFKVKEIVEEVGINIDYHDSYLEDEERGYGIYANFTDIPERVVSRKHRTKPIFRSRHYVNIECYPHDLFPVDQYDFAEYDTSDGLTFVSKNQTEVSTLILGYGETHPKIATQYFDNTNVESAYANHLKNIKDHIVDPDKEEEGDKSAKIIMQDSRGNFTLCKNPVKPFEIDFENHYNDSIVELNEKMDEWMVYEKPNNRLVILYGKAGTGKTNWLKNYIQKWEGEVIFVPPAMAPSISEASFVGFMKEHQGALIILEDAEDVMRPRNEGGGTATSNLLNLTDGMMADFLNLKIIATHNNNKSWIDRALGRGGRCWKEYEFGPLSEDKSEALCKEQGTEFTGFPMTLSEIFNPDTEAITVPTMGFQ